MAQTIQTKVSPIFIGKPLEKMGENTIINELQINHVKNSSNLERALSRSPKIVILNCFEDQSKNDSILQTITSKSPESKIITIGKTQEDFKKTHGIYITSFLPADTNYNLLSLTLEQLIFKQEYNEEYTEEEIYIKSNKGYIENLVWLTLAGLTATLLWSALNHF